MGLGEALLLGAEKERQEVKGIAKCVKWQKVLHVCTSLWVFLSPVKEVYWCEESAGRTAV